MLAPCKGSVHLMHKSDLGSVLPHVHILIHAPEMICDKCAPSLDTDLAYYKEVLIADSKSDKGYQSRTVPQNRHGVESS